MAPRHPSQHTFPDEARSAPLAFQKFTELSPNVGESQLTGSASRAFSFSPAIALKIRCFHSSYVVLEDHPQFSPERESRAQTMRHTVMAANIRRVYDDIAPCAFPSAQPSLHTTRALDSRCDGNDGVGLRILTAARITADNEKAPGPPRRFRRAPAVPERLLPGCVEVLKSYWNSSAPRCRRRAIRYVWPSAPGVGECAARNRASPIITCRPDSAPILDSNCLNAASTI